MIVLPVLATTTFLPAIKSSSKKGFVQVFYLSGPPHPSTSHKIKHQKKVLCKYFTCQSRLTLPPCHKIKLKKRFCATLLPVRNASPSPSAIIHPQTKTQTPPNINPKHKHNQHNPKTQTHTTKKPQLQGILKAMAHLLPQYMLTPVPLGLPSPGYPVYAHTCTLKPSQPKIPNVPHTFSGSGYSTPKVSTVTVFIFCSVTGLSFQSVSVSAILLTTSIPSVTLPKAA